MPQILTFFTEEVCPDIIVTELEGIEKYFDISLIIALFAFPSTGGAFTAMPNAFLQGLYPSGKISFFFPADTSIEIITLSEFSWHMFSSVNVSKRSGFVWV